jgi:protein gp37
MGPERVDSGGNKDRGTVPAAYLHALTKNPKRYADFTFPGNCWCGTTVNSEKDAHRAEILREVKTPVRYLSIEPLLGEITFGLKGFDWIILGAMTGKNPVIPETTWIEGVVSQCRDNQIPLFLKNNLLKYYPERVQDFPHTRSEI